MGRRRDRMPALAGLLTVLTLAGALLAGCGPGSAASSTTATTAVTKPTNPYSPYLAAMERALKTAFESVHVKLPDKPGLAPPVLPPGAFGPGLGSRRVLGFLPSWEISDAGSLDYRALSEVAYYALQVEPHGMILETGQGWSTLAGGAVDTLVADAHAAGVRTLLTLFTQTQSTLAQLASDPAAAGTTLADQVAPLLTAHHFDGVDLDLEGQIASARHGFVRFVAAFTHRLSQLGPSWSVVLNTLPQAAVDPESFFDVKALAPYVDQLFVMAYDMSDLSSPGPSAPLTGAELSDVSVLASYASVVPRSKLILGIPFYGYDFTTSTPSPPSGVIGSPYAVTYQSIVETGHPATWDPVSETPYASFKRQGHWHQTWYDDPTSVALKVALAAAFGIGGVGAWDLGMATGEPQMTGALDGGSPPRRLPLVSSGS